MRCIALGWVILLFPRDGKKLSGCCLEIWKLLTREVYAGERRAGHRGEWKAGAAVRPPPSHDPRRPPPVATSALTETDLDPVWPSFKFWGGESGWLTRSRCPSLCSQSSSGSAVMKYRVLGPQLCRRGGPSWEPWSGQVPPKCLWRGLPWWASG